MYSYVVESPIDFIGDEILRKYKGSLNSLRLYCEVHLDNLS